MPKVKLIQVKEKGKWLPISHVVELNEKEFQVARSLNLSPITVEKAGELGIVRETYVIKVSSKEEGDQIKKLIQDNIPPQ